MVFQALTFLKYFAISGVLQVRIDTLYQFNLKYNGDGMKMTWDSQLKYSWLMANTRSLPNSTFVNRVRFLGKISKPFKTRTLNRNR